MKRDPVLHLALRIVIGLGIFLGAVSLLALFTGSFGAFFGFAVVGAGFVGLGWVGRRFLLASEEERPSIGIGTVAGVIFGGAGGVMVIGSVALFVDGEFAGAVGLILFGLVFCGAGYAGYRVFRVPEGKKAVMVAERTQSFRGRLGQAGQRTSRSYVYVDEDVPEEEVARMQQRWSEQPWTQRDDWAQGKVVEEGPGSLRLLIGFTVVWNIIGWGIAAFAILSELDGGDVPWLVVGFPLVGVVLIVVTVRTWIRRRKFGVSVLHLDEVPVYLGGRLRGHVQTGVPVRDDPVEGFRLRLACVERRSYTDRDGDSRVTEETLWSAEQHARGRRSAASRTLEVAVDMAVPSDLPEAELMPEDDRIVWRLKVTASVPGVDYAAQFELPVFRREEASVEEGGG